MNIGNTVLLRKNTKARILNLVELFNQQYADIFIEPDGPVQRVLVTDLQPIADPLGTFIVDETISAPLFVATLTAHQLQALLTQQGVLSAANFRVTPLPHQVLAVDFVLGQFRPRAVIADEVGLGKTIEAAMIFEELKLRRQAHRVVIITPAGLTHQWKDELSQKFGEHFVIYNRSLVEALREIHGKESNIWMQNDLIITSLDFVKPKRIHTELSEQVRKRREENNQRIFQDLVEAQWDVVIFDEAHKLSKHLDGTETARYKVGEALAQVVPVYLLLTATPHQGDPGRFLHLLNLVDPYAFNEASDLHPEQVSSIVWRTRKRAAVDGNGERLFTHRITDIYPVDRSGPQHELERQLYDQVTSYVTYNYDRALGRGDRAFGFLMILFQRMVTSSSQAIHDSLKKRLEKLQFIQDSINQEKINNKLNDFDDQAASDEDTQRLLDELIGSAGVVNQAELEREIQILNQLVDLARRAVREHDAKAVAVMDIIDQVCEREGPQTKFLIFTEFISTQKFLCKTLEGLGYKVALINGQQTISERIIARQAFASDAQFLVSTDAGSEGINLQFCHVMVNYDLPWNPMKLEQRIGRLDRIGQIQNVLVLNMLIEDTVESRVRQVLENKLALIREQYGEDKLTDILSTLQDEFQFDRLYMDAVLHREAEVVDLENIAQQVFERAKQILDQDDLLLPQMQAEIEQYRQKLVEVSQERIKTLLEGYLLANGEQLNEYTRKPDVFYFDLPDPDGVNTHYAEVVFDRERAVADDGLEYLHLNHPVIQNIMGELTRNTSPAVSQLRLRKILSKGISDFDSPGLFAIYRLRMNNNEDLDRQILIPVFIDSLGKSHIQLAQYLMDLTPEQVDTAFIPSGEFDIIEMRAKSWELAEKRAGDIFSETQLEHAQSLEVERKKVQKYYRQQESAVNQIAIENIRLAKQRELLERRRSDLKSLEDRRMLIPDLNMIGMAVIGVE
ncbi:helicase-related protein [Chloroflexota bacterium]